MNQEDSIPTLVMKRRIKKHSSPQSIFKHLRRQPCFSFYGDYPLACSILEGCLRISRVSKREYENIMKLLPTRDIDDTRSSISQNFRKYISKKRIPYEN